MLKAKAREGMEKAKAERAKLELELNLTVNSYAMTIIYNTLSSEAAMLASVT